MSSLPQRPWQAMADDTMAKMAWRMAMATIVADNAVSCNFNTKDLSVVDNTAYLSFVVHLTVYVLLVSYICIHFR